MTPEQTKAAAQVMIDFTNRKTCEFKRRDDSQYSWHTINVSEFPVWDWRMYEYRVKVEPRKYYVAYYNGNAIGTSDLKELLTKTFQPQDYPGIQIVSFTEDSK